MPNRRNEGCRERMTGRMIGAIVLGIVSIVIIIVAVVIHTLPSEDPRPLLQLHPGPEEDGELLVVYFGNNEKWKPWAETLDDYLYSYADYKGKDGLRIADCSNLTDGDPAPKDSSCFFDINVLGRCSYKGDNIYGFGAREPCFFLNPNMFEGWEPKYYKNIKEVPEEVPEEILSTMKKEADLDGKLPARLWISCEGKFEYDKKYLGPVEYLPHPYFESYYFPYRKELPYFAPVVAVHFKAVPLHVPLHVVCRVWAKDVEDKRPCVEWEMLFDA